jgi:hypothetical protein
MTTRVRRALGACYRSARPAIVDRGASWAVVTRRKSLWTVPELWKTPRARFPQLVGRRTERAAHNGPQGGPEFYGRRRNA